MRFLSGGVMTPEEWAKVGAKVKAVFQRPLGWWNSVIDDSAVFWAVASIIAVPIFIISVSSFWWLHEDHGTSWVMTGVTSLVLYLACGVYWTGVGFAKINALVLGHRQRKASIPISTCAECENEFKNPNEDYLCRTCRKTLKKKRKG
jgi:hypothetical protein